MIVMPRVWILTAHPMQVRTCALRAPKKWVIVNKLTTLGILTVTFGFRAERANHLRVAAHAPFPDIKVTAHHFERTIRFHCRDRRNVTLDQSHGNDFNGSAN